MVTGALDLLLGSEKGNSSFAQWPDTSVAGIYLEAIYVLECIAPPHLQIDRFLPPTPLRVLVDQHGNEGAAPSLLKNGDAQALLEHQELRKDLLPVLMEKAEAIANRRTPEIVAQARKEMSGQLEYEIARLKELQKVNRTDRTEEIELLVAEHRALDQHLKGARLRLDAIRLIQRG